MSVFALWTIFISFQYIGSAIALHKIAEKQKEEYGMSKTITGTELLWCEKCLISLKLKNQESVFQLENLKCSFCKGELRTCTVDEVCKRDKNLLAIHSR
ncbi:MAG: hypothetical protein AABW88_00090 [Nanoarchaeota archaeon]